MIGREGLNARRVVSKAEEIQLQLNMIGVEIMKNLLMLC